MKYLDEYRDAEAAKKLAEAIARTVTRPWTIMEVCGGQTHTIVKYGIDEILPEEIELVHGPGCPVCVTSLEMIDRAHAIASRPEVIFCSFGDMLRVPGSRGDLLQLKSQGGGCAHRLFAAGCGEPGRGQPDKKVVFFAIGFETTAPPNAMAVWLAQSARLKNFSVLVSHVLVPPSMTAILQSPGNRVQGFLGPGHVCTVMGYDGISSRSPGTIRCRSSSPASSRWTCSKACCWTVRQLEAGQATVENQYSRAVRPRGKPASRKLIEDVFEICDRKWRGVGIIPKSGYKLRYEYRDHDAERLFEVEDIETQESTRVHQRAGLRGLKKPHDCPAFGKTCTPQTPLGATMVSSEGACAAYYAYGRHLAGKAAQARRREATGADRRRQMTAASRSQFDQHADRPRPRSPPANWPAK